MSSNQRNLLLSELEPIALEHGLELVDIELVGAKKAPTVRVYLDKEGGIGFDQILAANAWIDAYMEEHDPFPGAYTLEVSSPGIDRPLRTLEHFARFAGETVFVNAPVKEGRSKWTGELLGVEGENVMLSVDGEQVSILFTNIKSAHVKGQIDFKERMDQE